MLQNVVRFPQHRVCGESWVHLSIWFVSSCVKDVSKSDEAPAIRVRPPDNAKANTPNTVLCDIKYVILTLIQKLNYY